jgi:hypothetical protein
VATESTSSPELIGGRRSFQGVGNSAPQGPTLGPLRLRQVGQLLRVPEAGDRQAVAGVLFGGNVALQQQANTLFGALNTTGSIGG